MSSQELYLESYCHDNTDKGSPIFGLADDENHQEVKPAQIPRRQ